MSLTQTRKAKRRGMATIDLVARPPARQLRLADQIYEQILQQIVSGRILQGAKLPSEKELCEMFEVSRPIVREAIMRLNADGLVTTKKGSGSFVQRRPAPDFIKFASAGGIADLFRYWELRLAVESEASLLAARRRDFGDVEAIEQALDGLARLLNTSADGREVDSRFHYAIAAASGNNLFVSIQDSLHDRITQGSEVAQKISGKDNHARLERIYQEHKNIFEAIMAGDGETARTAMRTHIENARDRMFGAPNPG